MNLPPWTRLFPPLGFDFNVHTGCTMTDGDFEEIEKQLATGGIDATLDALCERLKRNKKYFDLFDARLMQCRCRLGLPLVSASDLDELPEGLRDDVEAGYLEACREVGELLLGEGHIRQAWMYLRTAGEQARMRDVLRETDPTDDNLEEIVDVALHDGVDAELGFQLILSHYGTCNAITTFESAMHGRSRADQQTTAAMLIRTVHAELLANFRADLLGDTEEGAAETESSPTTLVELVSGRESDFGEYTSHIDTSHLASVVRLARLVEDRDIVWLAEDLTQYGRCLHKDLQISADEPFVHGFESYGLFFAAQLGRDVDEAVEFFADRAKAENVVKEGTTAVEVYIVLCARLGRYEEAIRATTELIPQGVHTSGFAPSLWDLSRLAGDYAVMADAARRNSDLLSFAISRMESVKKEVS